MRVLFVYADGEIDFSLLPTAMSAIFIVDDAIGGAISQQAEQFNAQSLSAIFLLVYTLALEKANA